MSEIKSDTVCEFTSLYGDVLEVSNVRGVYELRLMPRGSVFSYFITSSAYRLEVESRAKALAYGPHADLEEAIGLNYYNAHFSP